MPELMELPTSSRSSSRTAPDARSGHPVELATIFEEQREHDERPRRSFDQRRGKTLDTSDHTAGGAAPFEQGAGLFEKMIGQLRTREFFRPRELLIREKPDSARPLIHRLQVFFEPGVIRQRSEDGQYGAAYNVLSGEWTFREGEHETREVRDDFPHQPLSLWMGTPQFLPIWGDVRSLWRTHQFSAQDGQNVRASFSEVGSGIDAGYADIDMTRRYVSEMRFHSTRYTVLDLHMI